MEADELAAAHKRIAALEAELALTRDACKLFDEQAVVPPKRRRAIAEGLIARGHSARSACRITGLARSLLQYDRPLRVPDREYPPPDRGRHDHRDPSTFPRHSVASPRPRRIAGRLRHFTIAFTTWPNSWPQGFLRYRRGKRAGRLCDLNHTPQLLTEYRDCEES